MAKSLEMCLHESEIDQADAFLRALYKEISAMDPCDMIRLTYHGKVVARVIVGA